MTAPSLYALLVAIRESIQDGGLHECFSGLDPEANAWQAAGYPMPGDDAPADTRPFLDIEDGVEPDLTPEEATLRAILGLPSDDPRTHDARLDILRMYGRGATRSLRARIAELEAQRVTPDRGSAALVFILSDFDSALRRTRDAACDPVASLVLREMSRLFGPLNDLAMAWAERLEVDDG